jgi:chemotaxis protein CheD
VSPALELYARREAPLGALSYGPVPAPRRSRYLQPGQILACSEPTTVTTVLGSCVAVCLWDRRRSVGGVNHYLLPHWSAGRELSARFGPIAIARTLERLLALDCSPRDIQAKLFGGAWILAAPSRNEHIGLQNVRVARERLAEAGIPIVAEDVGGSRGRKLVFHTDTGVALVKML